MSWFKRQIKNDPSTSETLTWLANGLKFDVLCCSDYEVNDCLFYTKSLDHRSTMQVESLWRQIPCSFQLQKIKIMLWVGSMPYYGVIVEDLGS